ncbi:HNH endonuclease [Paenibacillus sp. CMAA1364]
MPISNKTRKILWGRSGNRCSICKHEMVVEATIHDDPSVVGEECHIISGQVNGPRYKPEHPIEKIDLNDNLILLCRIHHKMVDDQHETFTERILKEMKENHEKWVTERLNQQDVKEDKPVRIRRIKENIPSVLPMINSGKELIGIIDGALGYQFDHDEPKNEEEVELISSFLQYAQDLGGLLGEFESGERVTYGYELTKSINQLLDNNYLVFGARELRILEGGKSKPSNWPIAIVYIRHKDNIEIQKVDLAESEK